MFPKADVCWTPINNSMEYEQRSCQQMRPAGYKCRRARPEPGTETNIGPAHRRIPASSARPQPRSPVCPSVVCGSSSTLHSAEVSLEAPRCGKLASWSEVLLRTCELRNPPSAASLERVVTAATSLEAVACASSSLQSASHPGGSSPTQMSREAGRIDISQAYSLWCVGAWITS